MQNLIIVDNGHLLRFCFCFKKEKKQREHACRLDLVCNLCCHLSFIFEDIYSFIWFSLCSQSQLAPPPYPFSSSRISCSFKILLKTMILSKQDTFQCFFNTTGRRPCYSWSLPRIPNEAHYVAIGATCEAVGGFELFYLLTATEPLHVL